MGVWTNINGYVRINKKERVSIRHVIEEIFGSEKLLKCDTREDGEYFIHDIDCNLEIDGYEFIKKKDDFFNRLKAKDKDLTVSIRFL